MSNPLLDDPLTAQSNFDFLGFALSDCVVNLDQQAAKYLLRVHRTALELAIHNHFGVEIGGFWLMPDQVYQLRELSEYYPPDERPLVACAVEAYLHAQLQESYNLLLLNSRNKLRFFPSSPPYNYQSNSRDNHCSTSESSPT